MRQGHLQISFLDDLPPSLPFTGSGFCVSFLHLRDFPPLNSWLCDSSQLCFRTLYLRYTYMEETDGLAIHVETEKGRGVYQCTTI